MTIISEEGTDLVARIRGRKRSAGRRDGAAEPALTPDAGLAVVGELCERLGVIGATTTHTGTNGQHPGSGPACPLTNR